MESHKSEGPPPTPLPAHGEIFSSQQDAPPVSASPRAAEDRVVSVSPERLHQALTAERILEQRRKNNREYQKRWRKNHRKEHRDKVRDWEQSEQGKKTKAAYMRIWRARRKNPPV